MAMKPVAATFSTEEQARLLHALSRDCQNHSATTVTLLPWFSDPPCTQQAELFLKSLDTFISVPGKLNSWKIWNLQTITSASRESFLWNGLKPSFPFVLAVPRRKESNTLKNGALFTGPRLSTSVNGNLVQGRTAEIVEKNTFFFFFWSALLLT